MTGRGQKAKDGQQPPFFKEVFFRWGVFMAWTCAMVWLSLTPSPPDFETPLLAWDKLQHAAAYGLFTLLAGRAFGSFPWEAKKRWLIALILAVVVGGALEVAQAVLTEERTAELADLIADLAGAGGVYFIVMKKTGKREDQE